MNDKLKLKLDRAMVLQLFTYMDKDGDMQLMYRDFCTLCAEHRT